MRRVELGAAATLLAMLLAGCVQPTDPSPSASPSPTFMCTPEAGGDQAPCSEADYQKMKEKDALYAEAEQVYRKYQAEFLKAIRKGGSDTLPAELAALIGHTDVKAVVLHDLQSFKKQRLRIKGPGAKVASGIRRPSRTKNGSVVAMEFCLDSRETKILSPGEVDGSPGVLGVELAYFAEAGGSMKIVGIVGREVKKCPVG